MPHVDTVMSILEDAKARDIRVYDVGSLTSFADVFIIATGDADRHIDTMAESIRRESKNEPRRAIEGSGSSGWVLIDLGNIVVHLFTAEKRLYYGLDELWAEGARSHETVAAP